MRRAMRAVWDRGWQGQIWGLKSSDRRRTSLERVDDEALGRSAGWALLLVPANALSTSTPPAASAGSTARVLADVQAHLAETGGHAQKGVYQQQYSAGVELDQAAFRSGRFWADVTAEIPRWRTDPKLKRFRQFCEHLAEREPGVDVFLENGQQILSQYEYPGLDGPRSPYPAADFAELAELKARLERDVAPVARAELAALLDHKPVVSDDAETARRGRRRGSAPRGTAGSSCRCAARAPLHARHGGRAARACRGRLEEVRPRAPLRRARAPEGQLPRARALGRAQLHALDARAAARASGQCGIVVRRDRADRAGRRAVVLDNTFVHHVYNATRATTASCSCARAWHPSLSSAGGATRSRRSSR